LWPINEQLPLQKMKVYLTSILPDTMPFPRDLNLPATLKHHSYSTKALEEWNNKLLTLLSSPSAQKWNSFS
jgi:hypothetical protein